MSYLFGLSEQENREALAKVAEGKIKPEDFAPRLSDFYGAIHGFDDFSPMIGDSIILIISIVFYLRNKNMVNKFIFKKFMTPIQRSGFVLVIIGFLFVLMGIFYDIYRSFEYMSSWHLHTFLEKVFNAMSRSYMFHYALAWFGLIIISVGIWLAWIHDHTTAKLLRWIKTGSLNN